MALDQTPNPKGIAPSAKSVSSTTIFLPHALGFGYIANALGFWELCVRNTTNPICFNPTHRWSSRLVWPGVASFNSRSWGPWLAADLDHLEDINSLGKPGWCSSISRSAPTQRLSAN